ncbi:MULTISPECIES: SGNH/GDSL hydrolase family protein [Pseudonocardia]|uniref:Lysophospholipase L1 n=1 Tax=Pseudonocardia oroxyli TaxID=366584 RepID=A0A1G7FJS4_PSEOR|nr:MULTISPECIES: SGNH/GDSL hydrolase family protein [Pseudonocardia]MCF7552792.1 SGNH/GDSL hydrolase family protein [Pseudonocardia sp. WMMC193]SDE76128.1 Lysophospholipase L1 [Pseudonocardia oroxyli]
MHRWNSFVAIGDSFTEGLDDLWDDGAPRGWADRLAERLAAGRPGFTYANLAVRGKILDQIVTDQVPVAEQLRPDLISFCAGGNDIIGITSDPDDLARRVDAAVERLAATGADIIMFTGFDLRRMHMLLRRLRGRVATFNENLRAVADRHGCHVVDLWGMDVLADPRAWASDRLHLTPEAHERVALRALEVLGEPVAGIDWRTPWPAAEALDWRHRQVEDLRWVREHVLPYARKRLRGAHTGDGNLPKRPNLTPLPPV